MRVLKMIALAACLAAPAVPAAPVAAQAPGSALANAPLNACVPRVGDYSFRWWPDGYTGRDAQRRKVLCFQTGRYGLALDVEKAQLLHLGPIASARPAKLAVADGNEPILSLPPSRLELNVVVGGRKHVCLRAASSFTPEGAKKPDRRDDVRLIDSGRFVQRTDIAGLIFAEPQGVLLAATGRLEIVAWPDRLTFVLDVTPQMDLPAGQLQITVTLNGQPQTAQSAYDPAQPWKEGQKRTVTLTIQPGAAPAPSAAAAEPAVTAIDLATQAPLTVTADAGAAVHHVTLPAVRWPADANTYYPEDQLDRLERYRLTLANPTDAERTFRLAFDRDYTDIGDKGITGLTPIVRDLAGKPTGIPVQISKNWHKDDSGDAVLYQGVWFHGYTLLHVPARSQAQFELSITFARWGGVPAASHAQLSLIGFHLAPTQIWDQVAVGSFGESICYEPESCARGCMIMDWRPLLVWQRNTAKQGKYGWTANVGGGDFLVYLDPAGRRQPLVRVKAHYEAYGPNLTYVTYAGVTADGAIRARINVSSLRSDDVNRVIHLIRYDVLKPAPFTRLAFYQVGADHYNAHVFASMARGDETGMLEEWAPQRGGEQYDRKDIACDGRVPWFSLHGGQPGPGAKDDTWANRGLIIRSWRARLGGQDAPKPYAAAFRTQDGPVAGANLELSPPPGVTQLQPGDFVQAQVEAILVPQAAADYYGPNANLRAALAVGADTWRPVFREAVGNDLKVEANRGRVALRYPIIVLMDDEQVADFEVTGGVGYAPLIVLGLKSHDGYELWRHLDGLAQRVDQSVHGNDFWQTDYDPASHTWRRTYNVSLDSPGDRPRKVRFVFQKR